MRTNIASAFIFSVLMVLTAGLSAAEPPSTANSGYAALRDQGDAKAKSGDVEGALTLWLQARDLTGDDVRLYQRIAKAAEALGRRQVGLDALSKIGELRPELKQNPEIIALRQKFEAMPAEKVAARAPAPLPPDKKRELTLLTAEAIVDDIRNAAKQGNADPIPHLVFEGLLEAAPVLMNVEERDPRVFYLAGQLALAGSDADLASYAMEGIERLDPNYLDNADHRRMVVALRRLGNEQTVQQVAQARAAAKPQPVNVTPASATRPTTLPADQMAVLRPVRLAMARACLHEATRDAAQIQNDNVRADTFINVTEGWLAANETRAALSTWKAGVGADHSQGFLRNMDHIPGDQCDRIAGGNVDRMLQMAVSVGNPDAILIHILGAAARANDIVRVDEMVRSRHDIAYTAAWQLINWDKDNRAAILVMRSYAPWLRGKSVYDLSVLAGMQIEAGDSNGANQTFAWAMQLAATGRDQGFDTIALLINDESKITAAISRIKNPAARNESLEGAADRMAYECKNIPAAKRFAAMIDEPLEQLEAHASIATALFDHGEKDAALRELQLANAALREVKSVIPPPHTSQINPREAAISTLVKLDVHLGDLRTAEELVVDIATPSVKSYAELEITKARLADVSLGPSRFTSAETQAASQPDDITIRRSWWEEIAKAYATVGDWPGAIRAAQSQPDDSDRGSVLGTIFDAAIDAHNVGAADRILAEMHGENDVPKSKLVEEQANLGDLKSARALVGSISDRGEFIRRDNSLEPISRSCVAHRDWDFLKDWEKSTTDPACRANLLAAAARELARNPVADVKN
jgi:tetratricopeptide (TPR) repeat protein